jgi:hypothetical protein
MQREATGLGSLTVPVAAGIVVALITARAAAEPAPLVDRPQHALLLRDSGGGTRIWIDSLTPQRLTYRACDTAPEKDTLTARPGIRLAVKLLSGETFAIDPRTGRFDRFDELTGRFTTALDKAAAAAAADPKSGSEIHTEVAEGTGTNASEALREAFRTAVRQAVGVYVDSETLSQKEEIVSDRLTTFSDAFVVRYEELERETVDGLVRVKISAAIEVGKMLANLRESKIDTLDLAGQDLVACAVTRKEARDAAAALLYRKFCELPNVLSASTLPFRTGDYDAETGKLTVTYTLLTDHDRYRAFLDSALPLLTRVAKGKTVQLVKVKPIWCDGSAPAWETTTAEDRAGKKRLAGVTTTDSPPFRLGPDLAGLPDSWCLWLMTRWSRDHLSTQWTGFALDIDLAKTLGDVEGSVRVRLDLVDAAGEVVRSETHDPLTALPRPAYWFGWAIARPRRFDAKAPRTWPPASSLYGAPILLTSFREPEFAVHQNQTVNVYVNPLCFSVIGPGQVKLSPGAWQILEMPIDPDTLARVKSIRATPIFVPHE